MDSWQSTLLTADAVGRWLAYAYVMYAMVALGLPTVFGLHALMIAVTSYWWRRAPLRRPGVPDLLTDGLYGFANPLIYLVIITAAGPLWVRYPTTRAVLSIAAWTLFAAIWGIRLLFPEISDTAQGRRSLIALLSLGALVVLAHGVFDLITVAFATELFLPIGLGSAATASRVTRQTFFHSLQFWAVVLSLVALYVIPAIRIGTWLRSMLAEGLTSAAVTRFLLPRSIARPTRLAMATALMIVFVSSAPRWSSRHTQTIVLRHRDAIVDAARQYDVSPRALAAVLYVTQRDQLSPLRDVVERALISAWALDEKSNYYAQGLNVSIGLMQVKPTTLQSVARIHDYAVGNTSEAVTWSVDFKHMREATYFGEDWRLPAAPVAALARPFRTADKADVVTSLLDDGGGIRAAALILALYQLQWESANPAWSIRDRPDILATLYQIGFERSHPHAHPRANRFGRRVKHVHDEAWLQAAFPARSVR